MVRAIYLSESCHRLDVSRVENCFLWIYKVIVIIEVIEVIIFKEVYDHIY